MQGRTFLKTYLFRGVAILLLAVTAGIVILPESDIYADGKTFVKSPAPVKDNFALAFTADDIEDADDEGSTDTPISPALEAGTVAFISWAEGPKPLLKSWKKKRAYQVYLFHQQLLI
jgi:hypothetical protein